MFDKTIIQEKLRGIVGFNSSLDPEFFAISELNQESRSGYFFNDVPYASLESLRDTQGYAGLSEVQFNNLLTKVSDNAISSIANAVFTNANTPSFIDRQKLYKYALNKSVLETGLLDGFVGHRIRFDNKPNVTAEITTLGLDFQGTGELEILLYSSESLLPIESQIVQITSDTQEVKLNWKIKSQSGEYYIGYIYDGSLIPYKRSYNQSNLESNVTFLWFTKSSVKDFTGGNIWDLTTTEHTSQTTGLNIDVSVYYDWTDLIVQNEILFANAIYLQGAISFLNYIKSSLRSNKNQRISEQQMISLEQTIEGQEGNSVVRITGLRPSLNDQIKLIAQRVEELRKGYFTGRTKTITLV